METTKQFRPKRKDMFYLPPDLIEVEEGFNPRLDYGDIDALAESIIEHGIKNPLRGFKKDKKGSEGKYMLTDGHRRLRAAIIVHKTHPEILIPFIIDKSEKSAEQRIIDVMICNDGLKLNPLEEADVINRLVNFGLSEKDIVKKTGKTGVYVSNLKLLQSSPQKIKNLIIQDVLSATLAMKVLRDTKNYEEAVKIIEDAVGFAQKEGKTKVVERDLNKSQGKTNSYSAMRKCFKSANKNERVLREDKVEIYDFVTKIIEGGLSQEEIDSYFFEEFDQ